MKLTYNDYINKICYYEGDIGPSAIPSKYVMILSFTYDNHNPNHPLVMQYIELDTLKEGVRWSMCVDFLNSHFKILG